MVEWYVFGYKSGEKSNMGIKLHWTPLLTGAGRQIYFYILCLLINLLLLCIITVIFLEILEKPIGPKNVRLVE